jgi:hypothetical protein
MAKTLNTVTVNKILKSHYDSLVEAGTITPAMIQNQVWIFTDDQFVSADDKANWDAKVSDKTFVYDQTEVASDTWVIVHNLHKYPSVTVVDSANSVVEGDVTYNSEDQLTITFKSGFKGKATLN